MENLSIATTTSRQTEQRTGEEREISSGVALECCSIRCFLGLVAISIGLLVVKDEKRHESEESERAVEPQVTLDRGKPGGNGRAEEHADGCGSGNSTLPRI
ncbi:hypothetical protein K0M31_014686 [Melipona bicolor]|uniref:Uncharacterized protein n=1 Tax=Melipona bicolor TaxID=60889 RepID=A0AA40KG30_9HYME|nr:hypothetical protein K0M31_014686 [Melipona bicolor]